MPPGLLGGQGRGLQVRAALVGVLVVDLHAGALLLLLSPTHGGHDGELLLSVVVVVVFIVGKARGGGVEAVAGRPTLAAPG